MANKRVFNKFFVQIDAESSAGAKHKKMRLVPRVPNGKKTESFLILPFCGPGPTQASDRVATWILRTAALSSRGTSLGWQSAPTRSC